MNIPYFAKALVAASIILQITSCYKVADYFPDKKSKHCQIKQILLKEYSNHYNASFYYSKQGDPDSVIFGFISTGFYNMHFYYDHRRHLKESRFIYNPLQYDSWHRYGYTNDMLTTDTMYVWGDASHDPEPANYYSKKILHFTYDSKGRIIKEYSEAVYPYFPPLEFPFEYDERGNRLFRQVPRNYDNYINPHQLHPIWQFLARDYSVNNPIPANSYNNRRLPLVFDQPHVFPIALSFAGTGRSLEKSQITYECK